MAAALKGRRHGCTGVQTTLEWHWGMLTYLMGAKTKLSDTTLKPGTPAGRSHPGSTGLLREGRSTGLAQ
eukprot:CAMPEP_0177489228 /NCGR_PEP_ID=MMETSP0369-20130122/30578_1 /TAXON_ID=447022 ORGANISM="Scrippsiella hangoei-like, Strain SHHI-4" /NCGR_SAMPLE_ID=MMETSP0369 /ASSEMBLY_ACC=CAM_ASM_000364 /LENGTH=68 /DNA_ID=CAMNT_0018965651 /DNA_START=155 /DNA_END=358 /DNA_ORIENTATION=+